MRVEITEVGKLDGHYGHSYTRSIIGRKGTLATERIDKNGFACGPFYQDDGFANYFLQVKTKPIFDDQG